MCNYKCPLSERRKCAGFLLCRAMQKDGVNYDDRKNATDVICIFQKQCMKTGLMENSDGARACYESRRYAPFDAEVEKAQAAAEETVEVIPLGEPKKSRRKKAD